MTFKKQNKKYRTIREGFTLIEVMVTISIFALLSSAVLVNFRNIDNSLILRNVAHQVGLVVRKAQISGISVLGIGSGTGEVFPSYGINFDMSGASPHDFFTLFADQVANNFFNVSVCGTLGGECVQRYTLAKGYSIKDLCGNIKTGGGLCGLKYLDITFTRPNPDAFILGDRTLRNPPFSDAEIVIQSRDGSTKTLVVWRTGQISIE